MNKKVLVIIPDGTGIRNYMFSDFIKKLSQENEIILCHSFNDDIVESFNIVPGSFTQVELPKFTENIVSRFLREALCYARLCYNTKVTNNSTIMVNWRRKSSSLSKKVFYTLVEKFGSIISKKYSRIIKWDSVYHNREINQSSNEPFIQILEKYKPDAIFTTHQRALQNIPFFASAKALDITSASVIYSWDNMPKARIPYKSDYFFVWSDYMKNEFDLYYPEIEKERVIKTGTPQFEFYLDKNNLLSRKNFCDLYGLNPDKKIICYSGDDYMTSPYDPDYLRDLALSIKQIEEKNRPELLFRRCPVDNTSRFDKVLEEFKDIIFDAPPKWNVAKDKNAWSLTYPSKEDVNILVNVAYHCDAVVNLGSTMAHDFAMFNKAAFYLDYVPLNPSDESLNNPAHVGWSTERTYKYQHFRSMEGLDPVYWIKSKNDFSKIVEVLSKDHYKMNDQQEWKNRIIDINAHKKASLNLVNHLVKIVEKNGK